MHSGLVGKNSKHPRGLHWGHCWMLMKKETLVGLRTLPLCAGAVTTLCKVYGGHAGPDD